MESVKLRENLACGQVNFMVPPAIQTLMTGVKHATQDRHGLVTLTYTDHSTESARCPDIDLATEENFFHVVGTVQDHRPNTTEG